MRRRALALATAVALALGCAALGGPRKRPAMIAVEWLGGFTQAPAEAQSVELLLDVASSQRKVEHGLARFEAVRLAALRLVDGLPETASVGVSVLGAGSGACGAEESLAESPRGGSRDDLRAQIRSLEPEGEGSLPAALESLAASGRARRVVAFSDLGGECGGDLCAAAAALVDSGARLDLVLVGDAEAPACLAKFEVDPDAPPVPPAAATRPVFRVEVPGEGAPLRVAEGYADGTPVPVRAATGLLVVPSDPPIRIGPIHFTPATITRIQVLDFPHLDVPVREWRTSTEPIEPAEEAS